MMGEFVEGKKHGVFMKKTTMNEYFYQAWENNEMVSGKWTTNHFCILSEACVLANTWFWFFSVSLFNRDQV